MTTATGLSTLTYSSLTPKNGGAFDESGITEFGTETNTEAGTFDSPKQALCDFMGYLAEQGDGASVVDVTEAEGFVGWGRVIRVSHEEYGDALYRVTIDPTRA